MAIFFDGLKETVQAELFKEERPKNVVNYIGMAVKIDDRQYAWRTRNSKYTTRQQTAKPRHDTNSGQGKPNTSHGTDPGPMEIDVPCLGVGRSLFMFPVEVAATLKFRALLSWIKSAQPAA